jgi:hypothetical protein
MNKPGLIFGMQRWPLSIAAAWVLTRNENFVEGCSRSGYGVEELCRPGLGAVKTETYDWRNDRPIEGSRLGRRPVMLFPTVEEAATRLRCELNDHQWDFPRDEVLARFPNRDADQSVLLASVWRGSDPRRQSRLTFSHAAWWIASEQGTRIFALDDRIEWKPAFDALLAGIVEGEVAVSAVDPPPARPLSASLFDSIPVDYPAQALDQFLGSPYRPGQSSFVRCELLSSEGDDYFTSGKIEPAWRGLQVRSNDLLQMLGTYSKPKPFTRRTADQFVAEQFAGTPDMTIDDVRQLAKGRGNREELDSAYRRYKETTTGLPLKRGRRPKPRPSNNSAKR